MQPEPQLQVPEVAQPQSPMMNDLIWFGLVVLVGVDVNVDVKSKK